MANKLLKLPSLVYESVRNRLCTKKIYYVTEYANWSITNTGYELMDYLPDDFKVTRYRYGIRDSVVHYGSIHTLMGDRKINFSHRSNRVVATWFHVVPDDPRIAMVPEADKHVDIWHTSCSITKEKLVSLGIPERKIIIVPIGIDLRHFTRPKDKEKDALKRELHLPADRTIIGSFQKDGDGWKEGLSPKLVKGPDIFCKVVAELSKKHDLFVLLTGPARGFVKKQLEESNVPYAHHFLKDASDVSKFYKAIDLYLVTSRVEGGPKQVMEALASGVPLVTTKVGMAPDIVINGENGFLTEVEDIEQIAKRASELLENRELAKKFIANGLQSIKPYHIKNIADQHYQKLYKPLFSKISS